MWNWLTQMMPEKVPHAQKPLQRAKRGQSLAFPSKKQNAQAGGRASTGKYLLLLSHGVNGSESARRHFFW